MGRADAKRGGKVGAQRSSMFRVFRGLSPKTLRLVTALGGGGAVLLLLSWWLGSPQPAAPSLATATASHAAKGGSPGSNPGGTGGSPAPASLSGAGAATGAADAASSPILAYEGTLSTALAAVLSQVAGAGKVTCAVTVSRTPKTVLAENGTVIRDQAGQAGAGTLQMSQEMALALAQGRTIPTTVLGAPVTGVLVVASGASDPIVRAELTQGAEALFGLMANQVLVLP